MAQANAIAAPMVPPVFPPRPLNYVEHYDRMIDVFHGTYSPFLTKFGPESDDQPAALRDSVLAAENNIPKVFAVFQSEPTPRVSFIHRPTKFAPSLTGATVWDNEIFGLLGDLQAGNQVTLIKWPEESFRRSGMLRVPNLDTMDAMWAAAGADAIMLGPYAANAANTHELRARFLCPIPQRYVRLGLGRHMTPKMFWTDVIGKILADGAQADCSVLINFGCMVCTYGPTAADGGNTYPMNKPLVSPIPDQVLGDRKWQWVTSDLPALLGRDNTNFEAAVLQQTAAFHQAFQQQHLDAAGIFLPNMDPFLNDLLSVDEVNDFLQFRSEIPMTNRQSLYIRASYRTIADTALMKKKDTTGRRQYALVAGTPGIGKSVFLYYVMWRLIQIRQKFFFLDRLGQNPIYFDGEAILACTVWPHPGERKFWTPDLWCLVDSRDPTSIPGLPLNNCSVLLASTLRKDSVSEFLKLDPNPVDLYMPLWTKDELEKIASLFPDAANTWQNRFESLGGVPRLVLQKIDRTPESILMSACNSCTIDHCIMLVTVYSDIDSRTNIHQTLIHMRSEGPDYRKYQAVYASELAMRVIARSKFLSDHTHLQNLLSACNGNALAQSLCGYIFEPYTMDLLEKGGNFECRELLGKQESKSAKKLKANDSSPTSIDIPASLHRAVADRVEAGQVANQLYVPKTSNYTAIDAWIPNFGGFQMTVGRTHTIKGAAEADLAKLGEGGNRLFFLLPPLYYHTFTKKTPLSIQQFAILIPYPEPVF